MKSNKYSREPIFVRRISEKTTSDFQRKLAAEILESLMEFLAFESFLMLFIDF